MSRKPETRLVKRIREALLREVGGWWVKIHVSDFMGAGLPDLLGSVEGVIFLFEVKRPGEDPKPIQLLTMKEIREKGGACSCVIRSPEEAVTIVKTWLVYMEGKRRGTNKAPLVILGIDSILHADSDDDPATHLVSTDHGPRNRRRLRRSGSFTSGGTKRC